MAYYTGTANSFGDFRAALESAAVTAGWTDYSGVLGKNGAYVQFEEINQYGYDKLNLRGGSGESSGSLTGVVSNPVAITDTVNLITQWPATYHIHAFDDVDEIYGILNVNVEYYLHMRFGVGVEAGVNGHGGWISGMHGVNVRANAARASYVNIVASPSNLSIGAYVTAGYLTPALWLSSYSTIGVSADTADSLIYAGIDGAPEWRNSDEAGRYIAALLTSLPSPFNEAHILLPIKCIRTRPSGGRTILKQQEHARVMRIDNVSPEEIITYGGDQWKCYPFFKKDTAERNGSSSGGELHSGTFGIAIRYDGS